MTLTPSPSTLRELILEKPDRRAAALARALGCRQLRRNGRQAFFMGASKAEQFAALYEAGFHAVRRGGVLSFRRDPRPLNLYAALRVARSIPLDGKDSLTANALDGSLAAKAEPLHTD